jgi:hypothetical protein
MSTDKESRRAEFQALAQERATQREEEAAREANGGKSGFVSYKPAYAAFSIKPIKTGIATLRLLGHKQSFKGRGPTDCKLSKIARIVGKDNKMIPITYPTLDNMGTLDDTFILRRIAKAARDGTWNETTNEKDYKYADTEAFKLITKNNKAPTDKYYAMEKGWSPDGYFNINTINRSQMQWHRDNKKTIAISDKYSPPSDPTKKGYFDDGVGIEFYRRVADDVIEFAQDSWEEYDVIVEHLDDKPWYKAFHGITDAAKISSVDRYKPYVDLVVQGPLTDEELSWERWDFDKAFQVTSYKRIYEHLGSIIKLADGTFGTNFFEELQELVDKEAKEKAALKAAQGEATGAVAVPAQVGSPTPAPTVTTPSLGSGTAPAPVQAAPAPVQAAPAPVQAAAPEPIPQAAVAQPETVVTRTRGVSIPWDKLEDGSYNGIKYLGVSKLTAEEKATVTGINSDGSWQYNTTDLYNWGDAKFASPSFFKTDPLTGEYMPPPNEP